MIQSKDFRQLLLSYCRQHKILVVSILVAIILLSFSQALAVLIVGPLLKFMSGAAPNIISLRDWMPSWIPFDVDLKREIVLAWFPWMAVGVAFFRGLTSFCFESLQARLVLGFASEVRLQVFRKTIGQSFVQIQSKPSGTWVSYIVNDIVALQVRVSDMVIGLIRDGLMIGAAAITLALIDWRSGVILIVVMPFVAMAMGRSGSRISGFASRWQNALAQMNAYLLDLRHRFEFVKVQYGEQAEMKRFDELNKDYFEGVKKSLFLRSVFAPFVEWCGFLLLTVVLWQLSLFSGERLIEFMVALGLLIKPLKNFGEQFSKMSEVSGSLENCLALIRMPEAPIDSPAPREVLPLTIQIERAEVKTPDAFRVALEHLRLVRGKTIAITGTSGSGKSTLLKGLVGLWPIESWRASVSHAVFAEHVSYLGQEAYLFSGTLRDNIAYGNRSTDEDILRAAPIFALEDLIAERGLDHPLNALHHHFSGGQLQRIGLLRAWLRGKPILVFDEATSALDKATEVEILSRLMSAVKFEGRCLIMVTHRYDRLDDFDEVYRTDTRQSEGISRILRRGIV